MTTKGDSTRSAILDKALRMTSTMGLEALSLGNLAREVGMSKSGLFAHFDSKEALELEVLRRARERFVERVVGPALQAPHGIPRFWGLFEKWLMWDGSDSLPGGCIFMALAHELDDRPGPTRVALKASLNEWVDTLRTATRQAVELGEFRADTDVDQVVYEGYGIVLAYNHFHRMIGVPGAEARARAAFKDLIERNRS